MKNILIKKLFPVRVKTLNAASFILQKDDFLDKKDEIAKISIIPPQLGKRDFGKIQIHFKNPVIYE